MELTPQALNLLKKRYLREGEDWNRLCKRVANAVAKDGKQANEFYDILQPGLFLPNTPCLVNAGKEDPNLSACFVIPMEDSIEGIFKALTETAKIYQTGGGVGINFSALRPEGAKVGDTGTSSGPISFMKVFDETTGQLKQGGIRRGAALGLLSVSHPDIVKFIKCKNDQTELTNFNISIAITDEFFKQLELQPDSPWRCKFDGMSYYIKRDGIPVRGSLPSSRHILCDIGGDIPRIDNHLIEVPWEDFYATKDIWDLICQQSHKNGEPGLVFIDEVKRKNGENINCCNPCGEQHLEDYESCCLGSIDVSKFVAPAIEGAWDKVDYRALEKIVKTAVRFLDRVVDISRAPLEEINKKVQQNRKIGLGIMGFADFLIKREVAYNSDEAREHADTLMGFIQKWALEESAGKNKEVTCIAPTGSLSILANCSSGIEPNHSWVTEINRPDFKGTIIHPLAQEYVDNPAKPPPEYFITASQISWEDHVKMQAVFQRYVSNSISKTINMPKDATIEDVSNAFKLAHELKCKGCTIYRDGSRRGQVLTEVTSNTITNNKITSNKDISNRPTIISNSTTQREEQDINARPYKLPGITFKLKIEIDGKLENVYLTVSLLDEKPYEVFLAGNIRDTSKIVAQYIDTTTRLASLSMRRNVPLEEIIQQLEKAPSTYLYSIPIKIASVLKEFLEVPDIPTCPACNGQTIYTEGCYKCVEMCGWNKCG